MNLPIEPNDPCTEKIARICQALDAEFAQDAKIAQHNVSLMYLLAAQFINNARTDKPQPMRTEDALLFQLSGFKKPLLELIALSKQELNQRERQLQLLKLQQYFLSKHNSIVQKVFVRRGA